MAKRKKSSMKVPDLDVLGQITPDAAGLDIEGKRAYLCKEHYKQFKKGNKKEKRIERWRHGVI